MLKVCSDGYIDPTVHHRLLEDGQEIAKPVGLESKLPGEVGVPEKLGVIQCICDTGYVKDDVAEKSVTPDCEGPCRPCKEI